MKECVPFTARVCREDGYAMPFASVPIVPHQNLKHLPTAHSQSTFLLTTSFVSDAVRESESQSATCPSGECHRC